MNCPCCNSDELMFIGTVSRDGAKHWDMIWMGCGFRSQDYATLRDARYAFRRGQEVIA